MTFRCYIRNWLVTEKILREQRAVLWGRKQDSGYASPHCSLLKCPTLSFCSGNRLVPEEMSTAQTGVGTWPEGSPLLRQTNDLRCTWQGHFPPMQGAVTGIICPISSLTDSTVAVEGCIWPNVWKDKVGMDGPAPSSGLPSAMMLTVSPGQPLPLSILPWGRGGRPTQDQRYPWLAVDSCLTWGLGRVTAHF